METYTRKGITLSNKEEAYHWLKQAEMWLQRIKDAEERFEKACRAGKTRLSDEEVQYRVYAAAKENFSYQRAGRKLEAAERRATMYALFALLDEATVDE